MRLLPLTLLLTCLVSAAAAQTTRPISYMTIPLRGEIGREVMADGVRSALAEARHARADYVILLFESPGGSVAEMNRIGSVIAGAADLKKIAFVKQAISAAAVLAMTCPTIVMYPDSQIGGAVPMKITGDHIAEVDEKFRSIFRATCRSAAVAGGHDPAIIEAMNNLDAEFFLSTAAGKPALSPTAVDASFRTWKPRGKILTLTADEAVECGLAIGKATTLGDVRRLLGVAAWDAASTAGEQLLDLSARINREKQAAEAIRRAEAAAAQADDLRKQLDRGQPVPGASPLQDRLVQAKAAVASYRSSLESLETAYKKECAAAETAYREAVQNAKSSRRPEAEIVLAGEAYDLRTRVLKAEYNVSKERFTMGLNAAIAAEADLTRQLDQQQH